MAADQHTQRPIKSVRGELEPPGDKSISHRALILGALADGVTGVENLAPGADVRSTRSCLAALGVEFREEGKGGRLLISGRSGRLSAPQAQLDAGNSGTTIRLLAGVLAGQPFRTVIAGDKYLNRRPMKRIMEPLALMGAGIESDSGRPPLTIDGGTLQAISYRLPVASAQVKSAVLLAGLYADGVTAVIETWPSRDHTERLLRAFGAPVKVEEMRSEEDGANLTRVSLRGPNALSGTELRVPGDISSAAYIIGLGLSLPDSQVRLRRVGLNPTRTAFLHLLKRVGADIDWVIGPPQAGEPTGDITVRSSNLTAFRIDAPAVPGLIDEIPLLTVLATQADGETTITGAAELRVKETDRIAAIVDCLKRVGADIRELPDGLVVRGPTELKGGTTVASHGDHRIAMAMAVAGAIGREPVTIDDAGWVDISFPGFFEAIDAISS